MKKMTSAHVIFFGILVCTVAAYWLRLGGEWNEWFMNAVYLAAPAFGVLGTVFALKVHGLQGATSRPFIFFALAMAFSLIGEALWVYYEFILQTTPYPSVADYFYIATYPAFFLGLLQQLRNSKVDWKKFDPAIFFLLGIIAVLLVVIAGYFGVYLAYDASSTFTENAVAIGYGLADVLIVLSSLFVLMLAWEFRGGNLMRLYLALFFAFVMVLVADFGFAIYNHEYLAESWWAKNVLDTFWILEYLFFGLGFLVFGQSLKAIQDRVR